MELIQYYGSDRKSKEGAFTVLSEYLSGDMVVRYIIDRSLHVGMWIYPVDLKDSLADKRTTLDAENWARGTLKGRPAIEVEPLVHIKLSGDDEPGEFGGGRTMKWAPSNDRFHFTDQKFEKNRIITILEDNTGLRLIHKLEEDAQGRTLKCETIFENGSCNAVKIELLTSFSIGGISPYDEADASERLIVHRFRTAWSSEGRLVSEPLEKLHLERTWAGKTHLSERFGQIGSMPTRGWFPTALIEDSKVGVMWGCRLQNPVSWQIEIGRRHDDVVMSGGLADREYGHWAKTIDCGERFKTPVAWITCAQGAIDRICERLVSVDVSAAERLPECEKELPVVYNDWCTSWGDPRENKLLETAEKAAELGVKYFVIDAGWYMPPNKKWVSTFGDWIDDPQRFPDGIGTTAKKVREYDMIPGIWFEPEYVAKDSEAFQNTEHLLKRDGFPLTIGVRRAWDLNDDYVISYLKERIIGFLKKNGFGYVKIDHSETLGIGVDHTDSLGEGLRYQGEGTLRFLEEIRKELPDEVIEITAAGGNRLEASILQRCAMSSCSDAHGVVETPIIAASMHRLILPRQSLIWVVLHGSDTLEQMSYSLAAAFLGRMCLSGEIIQLDFRQLEFIKRAIHLYREIVPIIKYGSSCIIERRNQSWRHPEGWQAVFRMKENYGMLVVHSFRNVPNEIEIVLPGVKWKIINQLRDEETELSGNLLKINNMPEFCGNVFLFYAEDI